MSDTREPTTGRPPADSSQNNNPLERSSSPNRFEQAAQRILRDQLPIPVRERWQPLRIGLMNLFLFEDERFPFADGRLLLRGSNGAGKSRVLAMTLPLLLDGSFKATRVEPDRDSNRLVAWNLLMDDQPSATGYSWLEFGRIDDAGDEHFVTIGCGMKATRGQPIKPWFFITENRIDDTLQLKNIEGVPLTRRQLTETIESLQGPGQVFDTAHEYRRGVDQTLFRLGERYDPLIDLLLQLRQPQLAKKLDIDQLELALRRALPPLADSLLDDAAEAFRDLDQYRKSLDSDRQTLQNVERFLKPYREHVARGIKRSLKSVTSASNHYERVQRELKNLADDLQAKRTLLNQTEKEQAKIRLEIESSLAAISEFQGSPEMQTAQRLDDRVRKAAEIDTQTTQQQQITENAIAELERVKLQLASAEQSIDDKLKLAIDESETCRQAAAPEELQNKHHQQITQLLTATKFDAQRNKEFKSARKQLSGLADRFQKSAVHLIKLNQHLSLIEKEVAGARQNVERAEEAKRLAVEAMEQAQAMFINTRSSYWDAVLEWFKTGTPLHPFLPKIEAWSDQWHAWQADSRDSDPSRVIVDQAKLSAVTALVTERQRLQHELDTIESLVSTLADERTQREAGNWVAPPPRSLRPNHNNFTAQDSVSTHFVLGHSRQTPIDGIVPFWQVVDFKSSVPHAERGNWESALHDAGILDANLTPDGQLISFSNDNESHQIVADDMENLDPARRLSQVLQPANDFISPDQLEVISKTLDKVLSVIGVGTGAGNTWVANDGCWQNGPLRGRLTKSQPQYVGLAARQQWREIRLKQIAAEIQQLNHRHQKIESKANDNERLIIEVEQTAAAFPSSETLVNANTAQTLAQQKSDQASQTLQDLQSIESAAQQRLATDTESRDTDAADIGLSAWATRAETLDTTIDRYRQSLKTLDAQVDALLTSVTQAEQTRIARDRAIERNQQATDRLTQLQIDLAKANETVSVLRESTGKTAAEMASRLEAQRSLHADRQSTFEALQSRHTHTHADLKVIASQIESRENESVTLNERRQQATQWFASMHENGLLAMTVAPDSIPDLPWSMTAAIKLARSVGASLQQTPDDDDKWQSSQQAVHRAQTELQQTVFSMDGMSVEVEHLRDGLQMIRLSVQGERFNPTDAAARLQSDIQNREQILDAREQDTLEKYLLGEVAEALRNGMREAAKLVTQMTTEVSKRPMKTGMQMRFKWQRDDLGPTGLAEACEVLETDSATWSNAEREQIKQFLQRSIREQRDNEQTGSWHEHLRAALDYRLWHHIVIQRRSGPDANWQRLTKRTYGSGSGGEKAIALTLPQLAAAAAYYQSADELAPRFILLDEAFAGISSDMRESCLELIAAFKLDVVMTSESEWGMYAGVKQLAICQLDRFADINAVVNRVFIWNGTQMRQATSQEEAAEIENQPLFAQD